MRVQVCMNKFLIWILLGGTVGSQSAPSGTSLRAAPAPDPQPVESERPASGVNSLPDLLPKAKGKISLIGGTIAEIDHVRDEITVKVFGGGTVHVLFDSRTRIERDGAKVSESDLRKGERVYLDTMQADSEIVAKHIRVGTQEATGQIVGQIISYDARSEDLVINDAISARALKLHVLPTTVFSREHGSASSSDLVSGTLISITFAAGGQEAVAAREISILAAPGKLFVFAGRVVGLDLHLGSLVLVDPRDQKSYEIAFDPNVIPVSDSLREGAMVVATTSFDGRRYLATAIRVDSPAKP